MVPKASASTKAVAIHPALVPTLAQKLAVPISLASSATIRDGATTRPGLTQPIRQISSSVKTSDKIVALRTKAGLFVSEIIWLTALAHS